ncbi:BTAD domain-containing putative transcriptional regulator [Shimia sp. MIT1388]|uniref:BTAD domain-containing putative transcriptional regulator n=1 Tax=Shimia sp. MIT1388 TaxID=3096992 RepID=UPI00399B5CB1
MERDQTNSATPDRALQRLRIDVIGGFQARCGDVRVDIKKKKAAAILVLLSLSPDLRMTREKLRGVLWPDSSETAAQTSLRNAVWALKAALTDAGFDGVFTDRSDIWLAPERVSVDLDELLDAAEQGNMAAVMQIDPQKLAQFDRDQVEINDVFASRVSEAVQHVCGLMRHRLNAAADRAGTQEARLEVLQFVAGMDPADEGAARRLIKAYWKSGQLANALTVYQSLWSLLDQEYGEEPSEETQQLVIDIKSPEKSQAPKTLRPVIVVAQPNYAHLSAERAGEAEALRQALCANLSRFREWQIFDAALMAEQAQVGEPGAASYALVLQPQDRGGALACRAVLSDRGTGELLWSEALTDAGQITLVEGPGAAERLAVALNLHLSAFKGPLIATNTTAPSAYERWVEAQGYILQFTLEGWNTAEGLLDDLIRDYPEFSRAYSSRASIENMRQISFPGLYSSPDMHVEGLRLARRAIELDPMDSRGQLAMGWSAAMSRQFEQAELAFDLAFQYNENDPWTMTSSAVGLAFCDQMEASSRLLDLLFKLKFRLQPSHWSYVAATRFMAGDYEGCIAASEKSEEISHDVPAWHASALGLVGRLPEAASVARRFESIARANWVAEGPPERAEITRWLVSGFPIRNRKVWLALRDGLRLADMPVPDLIQGDEIVLGYQVDPGTS